MNFSQIQKELPSNFSAKDLSNFFKGLDTDKYLDRKERQFWKAAGANKSLVDAQIGMLKHRVETAKARWACITAKSQRQQNFKTDEGIRYQVNVYDNLTTISPEYERSGGMNPPDRAGEFISRFTERSRQRLMNKARRLNKSELPLPFFVTLTYHKNFQEPEKAKKHLNAFLQRWRRRQESFSYFWKLEPQKRGAVHFHLAMFINRETKNQVLKDHKKELTRIKWDKNYINALRLQIQRDWAEVTRGVDGVKIPFTRFDYTRKCKKKTETYVTKNGRKNVKTLLRNPRDCYRVDVDYKHLWYGTNVRKVDCWKMFLGYIYKYMQKTVKAAPFGEQKKVGRFWGFSYNLDFSPLKTRMVKQESLENLAEFCETLNVFTFSKLIDHLKKNAERKRQELADQPKKLQKCLAKYRAVYERQKRRYEINKDKIKEGYSQQFEIDSNLSLEFERYLQGQSVNDFFDFP